MNGMIMSGFQQFMTYRLPKSLVLPRGYILTAVFNCYTWTFTSVLFGFGVFFPSFLNLLILLTSITSHGNEFQNLIIH